MKLDRNQNPDGKGKYALIRLRLIPGDPKTPQDLAAAILANPECVVQGGPDTEDEFFPILLKDKYAEAALNAYGQEAAVDGNEEFAADVFGMAIRASQHPKKKTPD